MEVSRAEMYMVGGNYIIVVIIIIVITFKVRNTRNWNTNKD